MTGILGFLGFVVALALVCFCIGLPFLIGYANDNGWSWTIWRAQRARAKALNERAAALIVMGHEKRDAFYLANAELAAEARANQRAIESVIGS